MNKLSQLGALRLARFSAMFAPWRGSKRGALTKPKSYLPAKYFVVSKVLRVLWQWNAFALFARGPTDQQSASRACIELLCSSCNRRARRAGWIAQPPAQRGFTSIGWLVRRAPPARDVFRRSVLEPALLFFSKRTLACSKIEAPDADTGQVSAEVH
mmetsp:Transcript_7230/g.19364  ORF Transcript_7230/g.19364 Transcript_7230/m.19364 type:complete len:156 (-) Transcript_7230:178-645(-)